MEARAVGGTRLLQARGARLAHLLVTRECRGHVVGHRLQQGRQRCSVLDRLRRALRHEGQHGMAGVAQKRDAPLAPARQRQAIMERPDEGLWERRDQAAHGWVPAFVARQGIRDLTPADPRFVRPGAVLGNADHIHEPSGRDPVVHDMAVRSHPVVRSDFYIEMAYPLDRHQPAPGDAAGEPRLLGAEQQMAHTRMDAVGADHKVGLGGTAVLEARDNARLVLDQIDEPVSDMNALLRYGGTQELGEIAAVEVIVGRPEGRFDLGAERRALQGAAVVPAALVHGERPHTHFVHCRLESEANEQARGIGADLDAGADLADPRRLLVDLDVEAGLQEVQGGGEPAEAAADDGDFHSWARATARGAWLRAEVARLSFGPRASCALMIMSGRDARGPEAPDRATSARSQAPRAVARPQP